MKPGPLSAQHFEIIEKWRTRESSNYHYFELAEADDWTRAFWEEGGRYRRLFDQLDLTSTVELACGHGRHAQQIIGRCRRLFLIDTSVDAIRRVRERFSGHPHVSAEISPGGASLPNVESESVTAIFCYDAMVHFELETVAQYVAEASRVLVPSGRGLFHHSNYTANPTGQIDENPGWRNFMSAEIMAYLLSRSGLTVLSQTIFDACGPRTDALTLFEKRPAP